MIVRYIARQFSQPTGLLGRVIGRGMARRNEREARWTVDLLAIEPDARVLEIGFGPGVARALQRDPAPDCEQRCAA